MKRLLIGLSLMALLLTAVNAWGGQTVKLSGEPSDVLLLEQDVQGLTLRLQVGEVDFVPVHTPEGDFVLPVVKNFPNSSEIGKPALPMFNRLLSIPFGCEMRVEVLTADYMDIDLKAEGIVFPVMPAQPSVSKSDDPASLPFIYDRAQYQRDEYYGLAPAEAQVEGTMRSLNLGLVSISPFEYNPVQNAMKICREMTVRVDFVNPDWSLTQEMQDKFYSPFYEVVYDQILNYQTPLDDASKADLVKYPVKYLIISNRMYEAQLQPFIAWKIKKGFNVVVAYTDVIGATTTAIKSYIQSVYNAANPPDDPAPSFVLFVGDVNQIPSFSGSAGSHITDLRYCEFTGDNYPEIYYGRFSAQNPGQLQPQIDKTLEYEQYLMPDPSYLAEVTLVSGVDGTYAITYGNGQINYGTNLYFNAAHGITPNVWLYPASDASGAPAAIIQTVSDGVALYNYTAHCSHEGHADPSFVVSNIPSLQNYSEYLLGIGNCCLSNTFGESTPCFGEAFLQVAGKGGIGYIGGTNSTYWDEDYWWGVGYGPVVGAGPTYAQTTQGAYDGLFHDHSEPVTAHYVTNGAIIFAGNTAVSQSTSSRKTYYWEIYHLMGDPSVMTYIGVPAENTVNHPSAILMTAPDVTIQADPGSYIAISMDGVIHGTAYVGTSGSATIPLEMFAAPGPADLVITCQFKQPYITTLTIAPPDGPFVFYERNEIDDAAGNNDGVIDASENIVLGIEVENVGPDDAIDATAVLTTADSYVTITDNSEFYGTIPGDNGLAYIANAFAFTVNITTPDGYTILFGLDVSDADTTWHSTFTVSVRNQPDINIAQGAISQDVPVGGQESMAFSIDNLGPSPLDFSVIRAMFEGKNSPELVVPKTQVGYHSPSEKDGLAEPLYAGENKGSGGPDAFGYFWIDSDSPDGPAVAWVDITGVGTLVNLNDDDSTGVIPIGFDFPFYQGTYNALQIGSNGIITFGKGSKAYSNAGIPNAALPNNFLALFWDDLDPEQYGDIYYYYDAANERFIVSFVNVAFHYSTAGTGSVNAQAIITPDGGIVYQYGVMSSGSDVLTSSTIGIENAAGNDGLQVVYNAPYIHDNMAIRFKAADWMMVSPGTGTVPPFGSAEITVSFDPGDLEMGDYAGQLTVNSSDPDTPSWVIPVTMNVTEPCLCGDADNNGEYNLLDIVYLIDFKFKGGPAPVFFNCSDVNSDGAINVLDITYLIANKYQSGPEPNCP